MKPTYNAFIKVYLACMFFAFGFMSNVVNAGAPIAKFSLSPGKLVQAPLDGATVEENIYVFVPSLRNAELTLSWTPNPGDADGYIVYQGMDMTTPDELSPFILHDPTKFQVFPTLPDPYNIEKRVWVNYFTDEFELDATLDMCFRLRAYNIGGRSGYSKALCTKASVVKDIVFYLDDPNMSGAPLHREMQAPWDMLGEDAQGVAIPLDVESMSAGEHVITTITNYTLDVTSNKQEARFTVVKKPPQNPASPQIRFRMIHED